MNKKLSFILIVILFTGAMYANFVVKKETNTDQQDGQKNQTNFAESENTTTPAILEKAEINTVKIEINDGKYSMSQINVKKGERVKFVITNNGTSSHDMYSDLFAPGEIKPNETKEIEITPLEAGKFAFSCEIINCNGHKLMQEGYTIIVS